MGTEEGVRVGGVNKNCLLFHCFAWPFHRLLDKYVVGAGRSLMRVQQPLELVSIIN